MHVLLCGMMGCGKTTVGKRTACLMGKPWADTDEEIVRQYGEIKEIFAQFGEARFREMETQTLQALLGQNDLVLSAGGGLVLQKQNAALLKGKAKIVYLRAKADTLVKRLLADTSRPLLQGTSLSEKIQTLLKERTPVYESVADFTVDVDEKTVEEIAQEIADWAVKN